MKPIVVSSGEPAGIGPDLCLALAGHPLPIVVLGDPNLLQDRAALLGQRIEIEEYQSSRAFRARPGLLTVYSIPCPEPIRAGILTSGSASYVVKLLKVGADLCLSAEGAALVTAPVHKAIINQAGIPFVGHTEFFAQYTQTETVVMLLVSAAMRVSLVTTHLPLHAVPAAITQKALLAHLETLHASLQRDFGMQHPRIKVAGLNPHAGEDGYLGQEEITVIRPVITVCQNQGMRIEGPYSADTLFLAAADCDAIVTMYHDQGLPVLKYASFGQAVNVTCGLPFIRTSVDHGTALALAGTGQAETGSLLAAVELAAQLAAQRASR